MASSESPFEAAVDAIVSGDLATLRQLLRDQPALIHARSTRAHRSTLLIYTAANGVENDRQITPPNIVEIARELLEAGAEVDAEGEIYGGSTTLGLAATSIHPERAGVQNDLMQLLLDHGARLDHPGAAGNQHSLVAGCLANGRGKAAAYIAARGATLDLEGAAGVGRLDVVRGFFDNDGTLKPMATAEQLRRGFAWACEFGRTEVVRWLLDHGMRVDTPPPQAEPTGLHWAAFGGHADVVALLLERQAPVDVVEARFNGTPLSWALHGQSEAPPEDRERFAGVVAMLRRAGATVNDRPGG